MVNTVPSPNCSGDDIEAEVVHAEEQMPARFSAAITAPARGLTPAPIAGGAKVSDPADAKLCRQLPTVVI